MNCCEIQELSSSGGESRKIKARARITYRCVGAQPVAWAQ